MPNDTNEEEVIQLTEEELEEIQMETDRGILKANRNIDAVKDQAKSRDKRLQEHKETLEEKIKQIDDKVKELGKKKNRRIEKLEQERERLEARRKQLIDGTFKRKTQKG